MQKKAIVKIVILSIFTIILIGGGVVFFQRLKSDKQVYGIDLLNHIPKESNVVIAIRKSSELKNISSNEKIELLLHSIGSKLAYPFYLVELSRREQAVVAKLSSSQEIDIKSIIEKNLYPTFPPQKRYYKKAEILFYTTKDTNVFFVCSFFNGLFIAAYDYKTIQSIIDTEASQSLYSIDFYEHVEPFFKSSSLVHYQKIGSGQMIYSLDTRDSLWRLEGYIDQKISSAFDDSLAVDTSLFPSAYEAFQVERINSNLNDSLIPILKTPYYRFWIDSASFIATTQFYIDRYELYDKLNSIEKVESGKSLVRHGYTIGKKYSIYSGSKSFDKYVFRSDIPIYFAFKEGLFIYSDNKEVLRQYIIKPEANHGLVDMDFKNIGETYFFSKNLLRVNHPLIRQLNLKSFLIGEDVELKIYPDIEYYKIEISSKHF